MEVENPVLNEIIRIIEKGNNWRKEEVGNKSFKDIQKIYKKDNSEKKNCNEILVKWEKSNYVKVDWYAYKTDIGKEGFSFSLKNKNLFYEMAEITPKAQRIAEYRAWIQAKIVDTQKGWILNYYESLLENLKQGKIPEFLEKDYEPVYQTENKELIRCMDELNLLDELTYKRIFSKKVFKNSKKFEKEYEKKVISIARKWGEEGFFSETHDKDILRLMNLDDYSTTLSVKGSLRVQLNGKEIDYNIFEYGCDINTKMLEEMEVLEEQKIEKVISVENKANFVSMPIEKNTLIIFTHGFLTPLECSVLRELEAVLPEGTKYYHTGDLDLGGIQIFKFIKNKVFPKLEPLNMDVETYEKYLLYGEKPEAKDNYWKKIENEKSSPFEELVEKMLEKRLVIEQEAFLVR